MIFLKIIFRNVFFSRAALLLVETLRSFAKKTVYLQKNKSQKGVLLKSQISKKGVKGVTMKRKIYQQLLDRKEKRNGEVVSPIFRFT